MFDLQKSISSRLLKVIHYGQTAQLNRLDVESQAGEVTCDITMMSEYPSARGVTWELQISLESERFRIIPSQLLRLPATFRPHWDAHLHVSYHFALIRTVQIK